jgi:4-alpha-glucanotransferase
MKNNISRAAGVLLPVSSLPSPYGIGTLGSAAYEFVDALHAAGQSYWQVLPLSQTGYGDSPYQSVSAFAGNPYFIDVDSLISDGLLSKSEADEYDASSVSGEVDYELVYRRRWPLLRLAFARFDRHDGAFAGFCGAQAEWLDDYAMFMALKLHFDGREFSKWEPDTRRRRPDAMKKYRDTLSEDIEFFKFCQYYFYRQWKQLKEYANSLGVRIIGDIPIYVAADSADVWSEPGQFLLNEDGEPSPVAGVPPDRFSASGQRWGNPIYDWDAMAADGFSWWKRRVAACACLYDVIRIDHFIGIARYYAIPAECPTAAHGEWRKGPGMALIDAINESRGTARIIAEDLGLLHISVKRLLKKSGYPGMKVLLFAGEGDNPYVPHRYERNTTVYVGTHDNDTAVGFCREHSKKELRFLMDYFNVKTRAELPEALIRGALSSVADTAVIAAQDWLMLDNSARMNVPSTVGGNWKWRLGGGQWTAGLSEKIKKMTALYGRCEEEQYESNR